MKIRPQRLITLAVFSVIAMPVLAADVPSNPNFSRVTAAVDVDNDGKMSRDEWFGAGLPGSSFDMFEQGRGYVTQLDYEQNAAPPGIDINGDGFLTVEEFIEFDKQMSANMPAGGPPPPGRGPR